MVNFRKRNKESALVSKIIGEYCFVMEYSRGSRSDYEPCFWFRGVPVYAVTLLVATQVIAMIGCVFLSATGHVGVLASLVFSTREVLEKFQIWRLFTYPWINAPSGMGLLVFAIQMYFLYQFGRELERFFGRRKFVIFYAALVLVAPILLMLWSFARLPSFYYPFAGSDMVNFGVFVGFVMLYPGAIIFFSLEARWVGIILIGIFTLQDLAQGQWRELTVLWGECACAAMLVRRFCGRDQSMFSGWGRRFGSFLRIRHSASRLRSVREPVRQIEDPEEEEGDVHASVDPLLDKIAKHGISSLTRRERERLEKARETLLEKERRH